VPVSPEEEWTYWDTKATELRRGQLVTIQTAATRWAALLTALLGVFGTVAFAGGLTTVDKLPGWLPWVVRALTTLAAASAVTGIVVLSMAAGGLFVSRQPGSSATAVRRLYTTQMGAALALLNRGRAFAVAAAVLVLLGSLIVLWTPEKSASPSQTTVVTRCP